jgi:CRISPR-associated protein Cas2
MYVLITYDVQARRTRHFHKALSRYLIHEQNSVFAGELTPATLLRLRQEISQIAHADDRIFEVISENRHNVTVALLKKSDGNGTLEKVAHNHHTDNAMIF